MVKLKKDLKTAELKQQEQKLNYLMAQIKSEIKRRIRKKIEHKDIQNSIERIKIKKRKLFGKKESTFRSNRGI